MATSTPLGDIVAAAFATVGITKDLAQAVANAIGIEDCGCQQRQESLNELGRKWLGMGDPTPSGPA